jgi:hypothetical protein
MSARRQTAMHDAAMQSSAQLSWVKWMIWLRKNWKLASAAACLGSAAAALLGRVALGSRLNQVHQMMMAASMTAAAKVAASLS